MRYPAACSTAASSSGDGTGGATSTGSPLLFPGLPQEFSSSAAVVVTKKLWIFSRACHHIVQTSRRFIPRFVTAPEACRPEG